MYLVAQLLFLPTTSVVQVVKSIVCVYVCRGNNFEVSDFLTQIFGILVSLDTIEIIFEGQELT